MSATMKDVAKMAGVRIETVSRILNNGPAKPSTRKKVEAAIEALNYKPNDYTRGLKLDRTFYVGLIIPSVWQPFFAEFDFHVENALEKKFYKMHLCNSNGTVDKEREYLQMACNIA